MCQYCETAHTSRNLCFTDLNSKAEYSICQADGHPSLPAAPLSVICRRRQR
jgi:hypothetical protein